MQLHTWLSAENKSFDEGLILLQEFGISSTKINTILALKGTKIGLKKMVDWLTPISKNKPAVKQIYYSKNEEVKQLDDTWRRNYKTAHHKFQTILKNEKSTEKKLEETALEILDTFQNHIDPIWKDLKEFDATGKLPEVHYNTPKNETSIQDKFKRLNNLRTYISKFQKNEAKADDVLKWKEELTELQKQIDAI